MKKLLFMMFLILGTLSFAGTGKIINPKKINKIETTVACCTVGGFRVCGYSFEPLCDKARALYCTFVGCTQGTLNGTFLPNHSPSGSTGGGGGGTGCIKASDCDCGGNDLGPNDN